MIFNRTLVKWEMWLENQSTKLIRSFLKQKKTYRNKPHLIILSKEKYEHLKNLKLQLNSQKWQAW